MISVFNFVTTANRTKQKPMAGQRHDVWYKDAYVSAMEVISKWPRWKQKMAGIKMKSAHAIKMYLEQGHELTTRIPTGLYLTDGQGNYQLVDAEEVEEALEMMDNDIAAHCCTGCESTNCDCVEWYED